MLVTITIRTDNAAFHRNEEESGDDHAAGEEVARILRDLSDDLDFAPFEQEQWDGYRLRDVNGNTIGLVTVDK